MKNILNDLHTVNVLGIVVIGGLSIIWDSPSMIITMIGAIWVLNKEYE